MTKTKALYQTYSIVHLPNFLCDQTHIATTDNFWKFENQFQGNLCQSFPPNLILKKLRGRTPLILFCFSHFSFLSKSSLAGPASASWISGDYGNPSPPDWNWPKMWKHFHYPLALSHFRNITPFLFLHLHFFSFESWHDFELLPKEKGN